MAETAKIISPEKTVLHPGCEGGLSMADMITAEELRKLKREHPRAKVLCYVNTTAEVKAECDVCCTSGNAERIVREAFRSDDEIIFAPDQYLAHNISRRVWQGLYFLEGLLPDAREDTARRYCQEKGFFILKPKSWCIRNAHRPSPSWPTRLSRRRV